jgi:colanic acid biosynthesis glycosyl transferase WcaI
VSANFLPSKLLPALATRTPILVVAEADTPLAREVGQGGYGVVVRPGDKEGLKMALTMLGDSTVIERMSALAADRAVFFSRERVLGQYTATLRQMSEALETLEVPQLTMS